MQGVKPLQAVSLNIRRVLIGLLIGFFLLQSRFWFGQDSIIKVYKLKTTLKQQEQELAKLRLRNQQVANSIHILKNHPAAIEEQARYELGMVKQGEKYYQVVEPIE